jgi:hypothetical protein
MPSFDVAHIHKQGQDMIIIPMNRSFGNMTHQQQAEQTALLQEYAASAGLAGTVVPVWDAGGGRMAFLAPKPWHPFFRSINLRFVAINVNRRLSCNG